MEFLLAFPRDSPPTAIRESVLMGGTTPCEYGGFGFQGSRGAPTANPSKLHSLRKLRAFIYISTPLVCNVSLVHGKAGW